MTNLCPDCFDNGAVKSRLRAMRSKSSDARCDYHPRKAGVPLGDIAALFAEPIQFLYRRSGTDWDGEPLGDSLEGIIADLGQIDDGRVSQAIADQLIADDPYWPPDGEEPFFSNDLGYELGGLGDEGLSYSWKFFQQEIMEEHRFFSERGRRNLDELFSGIERQTDARGRSAVTLLPPGTRITRARVVETIDIANTILADPSKQLAPPPPNLRKAGRMNAAGIPALYGAYELATCVAELGPAVGSLVVSGVFELDRELLALDITTFEKAPRKRSPFAVDYVRRSAQRDFLRRFQEQISRPILDTRSHLEYVPTQVVAEFLTAVLTVEVDGRKRRIDALIYRSSQRPSGKNIVLFGDAARVKPPTRDGQPPSWLPVPAALRIDEATVQVRRVAASAFELTANLGGVHEPTIERIEETDDEYPI